MAQYNFTSLRRTADLIDQVAGGGPVAIGDEVSPYDIEAERLSGNDDISGDFYWELQEVHVAGFYAFHSLHKALLQTAQGLRLMANTAEAADNENIDNIFHRFAKYADNDRGTDLV
ncbi:MAG: hypothetical protein ACRDOO_28455 [Actinomadura sp.]